MNSITPIYCYTITTCSCIDSFTTTYWSGIAGYGYYEIHSNECFMIKEGQIINIPDYDKALYYTLWGQWDELLLLMVRTQDDLLSKKIHHFLNDYHYSTDKAKVIESHDNLLYYVEHAMKQTPTIMMEV